MKYSIDTSALLDGWRRWYSPESFPNVWKRIDELILSSDLKATEEVFHELEKKEDELLEWARQRRTSFFISHDENIQEKVKELLKTYEYLVDPRRSKHQADPFVIVVAQINDAIVITGEYPRNNINKPSIPDVCEKIGINWINLPGLIKREGWKF